MKLELLVFYNLTACDHIRLENQMHLLFWVLTCRVLQNQSLCVNVPKETDTLTYELQLRPVSVKETPHFLFPGWCVKIYQFVPRVMSCNIIVGGPADQEWMLFFLEKLKTWGLKAWSLETSRQKIRNLFIRIMRFVETDICPLNILLLSKLLFSGTTSFPHQTTILSELQINIFPLACKFLSPLRRQGIILQSLLSANIEWGKSTVSRQQSTGSLQLWWEGFAGSGPQMMHLLLCVQQ